MKNNSNKGMFLETIINNSNKYYYENRIAFIEKLATPIKICNINSEMVIGKLYKKSNVDYYGVYNSEFICFKAKQTGEDKFYLNNIKNHQLEYLNNILLFGGKSWLIVYFSKENKFFKVNTNLLNREVKYIDIQWCKENAIELKLLFPGRLDYL